jgi:hypothetical protein
MGLLAYSQVFINITIGDNVKILYLPTGEYLTFQNSKNLTQDLSSGIIESYGFTGLNNNDIITKLTKTELFDRFATRNNLSFPIIKEHFEVVL